MIVVSQHTIFINKNRTRTSSSNNDIDLLLDIDYSNNKYTWITVNDLVRVNISRQCDTNINVNIINI